MKTAYLSWILFLLLSASVLCFEVVATRVASVVFVSDFAYLILSLGILGLGGGGWLAQVLDARAVHAKGSQSLLFVLLGASYCLFIIAVTLLSVTSPLLFFPLLVLPFVLGGILAARLYKGAAGSGFTLYAGDLAGGVAGSLLSLVIINMLGAPNSVLFLALLAWCGGAVSLAGEGKRGQAVLLALLLLTACTALFRNATNVVLGEIAIGRYPEKDYYSVYPDPTVRPRVVDSRWSIFGRADLVAYSHQNSVMQLFVDGAAGTQVYQFNGNIQQTNSNLQALLLQHTNSIPFLCTTDAEKQSMLVIGPGGGKEVLLGLFGGVQHITGVEVNPDFVAIVKDHRDFNGGIYTDFPNVRIVVDEGRHYVRRMEESVDLLVMALPSTAQMQNIEPYATNENFLLTREALADYLRILKPGGALILTVHNSWELARIIVTAVSFYHDCGVPPAEIPNHFVLLESEYAPTVVIKKRAFSAGETARWQEVCSTLPREFPRVTYLPYGMQATGPSMLAPLLKQVSHSPASMRAALMGHPLNISPCTDDSPYFYNRSRWGPAELYVLLGGLLLWCTCVILVPLRRRDVRASRGSANRTGLAVTIAACAGTGFMVLEISLLQKLILWLGEATTSLAFLLAILLAGMGMGSLAGGVFGIKRTRQLLLGAVAAIVVLGILQQVFSSMVLSVFLRSDFGMRLVIAGALVMPLAIALGIPFPLAIQTLRLEKNRASIPWIYAVNCSFSVLGSVLAIVVSVVNGFTLAFCVGLSCYVVLALVALRFSWPMGESGGGGPV